MCMGVHNLAPLNSTIRGLSYHSIIQIPPFGGEKTTIRTTILSRTNSDLFRDLLEHADHALMTISFAIFSNTRTISFAIFSTRGRPKF